MEEKNKYRPDKEIEYMKKVIDGDMSESEYADHFTVNYKPESDETVSNYISRFITTKSKKGVKTRKITLNSEKLQNEITNTSGFSLDDITELYKQGFVVKQVVYERKTEQI